jgi:cysteine desulfurase
MIYLDNAAATPMDNRVIASMQPYFKNKFYNPSATYLGAKKVRDDLSVARAKVAKCLGSRNTEIIFTAGATEANNLAIRGVMDNYPGGNIITCAIEHESVLAPSKLYAHKIIPVSKDGIVELNKLKKAIDDKTALISVMYVNNEIGTLQPIREISRLVNDIRRNRKERAILVPLLFHSDAAQATNYLDIHTSRLGVDLMTINGGKIYGPKQTGILYLKSRTPLKPLILGGGQEFGIRNGTENIAGIIGFAEAMEITELLKVDEYKRMSDLQKYLLQKLKVEIPEARINGSMKYRVPNNLHITLSGQDNERLVILLDEDKIYCATGSACSAAKGDLSHVLSAIGLKREEIMSSLRISMGRQTTKKDLDRFVSSLKAILV